MIKKALVVAVILLFIGVVISPSINAFDNNQPRPIRIFNFNQYLDLEIEPYDEPIGSTIQIRINVLHWTDIPDFLLNKPFFRLKNLFLFGTLLKPIHTISLSVLNVPDWCNAHFSQPELRIGIDTDVTIASTSLIVSFTEEAPAVPFTIDIKAVAPKLKRINEFIYQQSITLTPAYVPDLDIWLDDYAFETPPDKATIIEISVKNIGNKISKVNSYVLSDVDGWYISLDPPIAYIEMDEVTKFILTIGPPEDFEGFQPIQIEFIASRYPYMSGSAIATYTIDITAYHRNVYELETVKKETT